MSEQLFKRNQKLTRHRKEKERNERAKVLIVCEDSKTSVTYFKGICKKYRIDAKVTISGECGSAPQTVVNYAIDICEKKSSDYDEAFCVIDRDNHDRFDDAVDKAQRWKAKQGKTTKLTTTASYPCFELWLLLHFKYTAKPYTCCDDLLPDLNNEISKCGFTAYNKTGEYDFEPFFNRIEQATLNSKKLETDSQRTEEKNPSTEIHELIEQLQNIRDLKY